MPLSFSLVWKVSTHIFSVVVVLQICSCMLSDPVHLDPPWQTPVIPIPAFRSCFVVASPLCRIQHHLQMPCCSHMFRTALCVCHAHNVDTSLRLPQPIPFSHLHCLSLRPDTPQLPNREDRDAPTNLQMLSILRVDLRQMGVIISNTLPLANLINYSS